jgi:hypothetical protein
VGGFVVDYFLSILNGIGGSWVFVDSLNRPSGAVSRCPFRFRNDSWMLLVDVAVDDNDVPTCVDALSGNWWGPAVPFDIGDHGSVVGAFRVALGGVRHTEGEGCG